MDRHGRTTDDLRLHEEGIGLLELDAEKENEYDRQVNGNGNGGRHTGWTILGAILLFVSNLVRTVRFMRWKDTLRRFLWFLVPSFLQGPEARAKIRPAKLHPTAYLDGMRGIAALSVYFFHTTIQVYNAWISYGRDGANYHFLQLPIVRLIYEGHGSVALFFVISGYALSYRPLKLIRAGKYEDFSQAMASMTFRRAIRLYLPICISTFIIFCLLRMRAYEATRAFAGNKLYSPFTQESHAAYLPTFSAQFKSWLQAIYKLVYVFAWDQEGARQRYDFHLWTIPIEFRCSLYLFVVILGTSRLQTRWRFAVLGGCILFTYDHVRWDLLLFLLGMGIAEIDQIQGVHLPNTDKLQNTLISKLPFYLWTFVGIAGLYLIGQPAGPLQTPGWVWLAQHMPDWGADQHRYWKTWGSAMLVLAVGRLPGWQRVLHSAPIQYLGKISYSLYLMHGPGMHAFTFHLEKFAYSITGIQGNNHNIGFALGLCMSTPFIIWFADIFWRAVDINTVKFAKWFESKVIVKQD